MSRRNKNNNHDPDATGSELVPVKFSRLTRRGILLGLSAAQLVTVAAALLTIVVALYLGGGMWLAYTAPIWATAVLLTWVPIAGRPVIEWVPVAGWWVYRTTIGQLLYRRRIVTPWIAPGLVEGLICSGGWSHACTEEVSR